MTIDELKKILKEKPEMLNKIIRQKVKEDETNKAGKIIYENLTEIYIADMSTLSDDEDELLAGILDALTGYCARECWIGTANYHLIS